MSKHKRRSPPTCPYCDRQAVLVDGTTIYPHRRDLSHKKFYLCRDCDAYVGCHRDSGEPYGRLANKELREARKAAHAAFDPLWDGRGAEMSRTDAYSWLARVMGLTKAQCHIGDFDVEQCREVVRLVGLRNEPALAPHAPQ